VQPEETRLVVRWDGDEPVVVSSILRARIRVERCKGCGLCVAVCPPAVLTLGALNTLGYSTATLVDNDRCTSCAACAMICPECAIEIFKPPRPQAPRGGHA
jgi:2-oxoglutarate ferredoxin oxidoreductase subunit delta